MYFRFMNFTDFCNTPCIASRGNFAVLEKYHWILDILVILENNVLNVLIVSHKLGHCDLFSYKLVTHVLYNNHDRFHIFLLLAVLKISILLKISGFYMFPKIQYFFRFSYRTQPGTSHFFLSNNINHHACSYAEIKLLVPGCADIGICI